MAERTIREPERQTPVLYDVDVVVVGGGTAGPVAAIAAARAGASVALVERFGTLGGCVTIGRCFHVTNKYLDENWRQVIYGLPVEVLERAVKAGGTAYPTLERTMRATVQTPCHIQVDPEVLAVVLLQMVEEAGVKLLLHTDCYGVITEGDAVKGVLVTNKGGRSAILARCVVDASGEADVAYGAGAPVVHAATKDGAPYGNTFGLLIRLNGVDLDRFMNYFLSLPAGTPDPTYGPWLEKYTGLSEETMRGMRYWRSFLDPQPVGAGVHRLDPGRDHFGPLTLDWFRKIWEADGTFDYVNMHFFRDILRQAADAGDIELARKVPGFGTIGFNFDGFTGGKWREGEMLINSINPMWGFGAFNPESVTKAEVAARERAYELQRFLRKYMPGFEQAHIIDTGAQALPRHPRMIVGEFSLTDEALRTTSGFDDAAYITAYDATFGPAHEIPYGIMVPQKVENVVVAGKCADGAQLVRSIPSTMAMGQAAGAAAALCAKLGVAPRKLDVKLLQAEQRRQGVKVKMSELAK